MTHLDPELLAGQALSDTSDLDPAVLHHLGACDRCRTELDELRQVARIGRSLTRDEELDQLVAPPADLWQRITAELEGDVAAGRTGRRFASQAARADVVEADKPLRQADVTANVVSLPSAKRKRGWVLVAVAAAIGLIVGAVGAVELLNRSGDADVVVAETRLVPLPGTAGSGTAELREDDGQLRLEVSAQGLPASGGDLELWLLNVDGERMQPLGLLTDNQDGSFTVPAGLLEAGYQIVDISLEPRDGNLAHSGQSELRGTLPA